MIDQQIVPARHAPRHRIAGARPNRHLYVPGQTKPQFRARYVIKLHGGSLTDISVRRSAR